MCSAPMPSMAIQGGQQTAALVCGHSVCKQCGKGLEESGKLIRGKEGRFITCPVCYQLTTFIGSGQATKDVTPRVSPQRTSIREGSLGLPRGSSIRSDSIGGEQTNQGNRRVSSVDTPPSHRRMSATDSSQSRRRVSSAETRSPAQSHRRTSIRQEALPDPPAFDVTPSRKSRDQKLHVEGSEPLRERLGSTDSVQDLPLTRERQESVDDTFASIEQLSSPHSRSQEHDQGTSELPYVVLDQGTSGQNYHMSELPYARTSTHSYARA
jgi:hypothetical protein